MGGPGDRYLEADEAQVTVGGTSRPLAGFIQETARAVVDAIIHLARALRLTVVAEGVETEEEAEALRSARCDELQGFLYSRPIPGDALLAWIEARKVVG